jgi:5-methylcytosine-specific restriction endonuclease McrA
LGRPRGELTRNGGRWTEAQFKGFVKNNLRSATRKWAPVNDCKKRAHVARGSYKCDSCGEVVPPTVYDEEKRKRVKNIAVDHIEPVVDPEQGFTSWDDVVDGLFCEPENLQLLCKKCHDAKSAEEISISTKRRGYYKTHLREYTTYVSMKGRCSNPKVECWEHYGGRGIKVCDRWLESFENFYADMGPRPLGLTLDRKDVDGDYEPGNCQWADWVTQANNRSSSIHLEYDGYVGTIAEWSRKTGVSSATISYRIRNDFTVGEALGFDKKPNKAVLRERREASQEILREIDIEENHFEEN